MFRSGWAFMLKCQMICGSAAAYKPTMTKLMTLALISRRVSCCANSWRQVRDVDQHTASTVAAHCLRHFFSTSEVSGAIMAHALHVASINSLRGFAGKVSSNTCVRRELF